MLRIGAMVIAIAAAAFALNLFLFDSADSTGSAGRLSPRASEAAAPHGHDRAGAERRRPPGHDDR